MSSIHRTYRGWTLVETGHNYYSACKGPYRIGIGSIKHGDREELKRRFIKVVNQLNHKEHK